MIRIVSGTLGSQFIKSPQGKVSRPTSSKVRAAVFDHLGSHFTGGNFLDLFAGSGIMSFEALSRGFSKAVLLEKDFRAYKLLLENAKNLSVSNACTILRGDTLHLVQQLEDDFDLIYADPPYHFSQNEELLQKIFDLKLLKSEAVLVYETSKQESLDLNKIPFFCYNERTYGSSKVWYFRNS